jgi:hypothetical protein
MIRRILGICILLLLAAVVLWTLFDRPSSLLPVGRAAAQAAGCLTDVDGDGTSNVTTDVTYIARRLLNFSQTVPPSFRAGDPSIPADATINAVIDSAGTAYDVDGSGTTGVTTDITYIARRLLNFSQTVPPSFRAGDPSIPADEVINAAIDGLCGIEAPAFSISAAPASVKVIQGESSSFAVPLASDSGFAQLAALEVSGLPAGLTYTLSPKQIAVGQTALLTISAPAGQTPATAPVSLSATATVAGSEFSDGIDLTVTVQAISTTFLGRTVVGDTLQPPPGRRDHHLSRPRRRRQPDRLFRTDHLRCGGQFCFYESAAGVYRRTAYPLRRPDRHQPAR